MFRDVAHMSFYAIINMLGAEVIGALNLDIPSQFSRAVQLNFLELLVHNEEKQP